MTFLTLKRAWDCSNEQNIADKMLWFPIYIMKGYAFCLFLSGGSQTSRKRSCYLETTHTGEVTPSQSQSPMQPHEWPSRVPRPASPTWHLDRSCIRVPGETCPDQPSPSQTPDTQSWAKENEMLLSLGIIFHTIIFAGVVVLKLIYVSLK